MNEVPSLVAELWYAEAPDLNAPALLDALRQLSGDAEQQDGSLVVPHPGSGSADQPLLTVVMAGSPLGTDGKQRPDTSQTWDWADTEAAVATGQASVLITELFPGDVPVATRVAALVQVVRAVAAVTGPAAISWPQSQRVTDPDQLGEDDLEGLINVRLFTVAGDAEALVMDTLGLHSFGLPDVQCHFRGKDPAEIGALLYSTAGYIFDAGDVIADGNTISGLSGDERYTCRREPALLQPDRPVIDIDLGDPYAAGQRDR